MAETETEVEYDTQTTDTEDAPQREVDYRRIKRWVIQREGKDFILYAGLLDLLHQESQGHFMIHTHLEQAPLPANGETAIVSARVEMLAGNDDSGPFHETKRSATGIGDANPGNVNRQMTAHTIRLAETRAKARALRDLLNIGLVAAEELGPSVSSGAASRPVGRDDGGNVYSGADRNPSGNNGGTGRVHEGADIIDVNGKVYNRDQVWGFYQQRMNQMRERRLPIPTGAALGKAAPLKAIVAATQTLRSTLEQAPAPSD